MNQKHEPIPGVFDSVGLRWSPRIFISNKFPIGVDAVIRKTHFENHCSRIQKKKRNIFFLELDDCLVFYSAIENVFSDSSSH